LPVLKRIRVSLLSHSRRGAACWRLQTSILRHLRHLRHLRQADSNLARLAGMMRKSARIERV
jgi:hypothetical protein